MNETTVHSLKTAPEPFQAVWCGDKRAEFRRNDRGFEHGNILYLEEWTVNGYTGRRVEVKVTHLQDGFGIPGDFVMMSFYIIRKGKL